MNSSSKPSSSGSSSSNPVVTYTSPYPLFAVAWSSHTAPQPHASSSSSSFLRGHSTSSSISTSPSRFDDPSAIPHGSRIAVGSFMEECSNSIQVLGYIGERDPAGQARLSALATANHPYPATKIAFQPSSLSTASSSSSSSSSNPNDRDRGYMSPTSKSAKRGSWGTGNNQHHQQQGSSPEPQLVPNDEAHDGFPNRELLATTADCLRIWECARNADAAVGPGWDAADEGAMEDHEAAGGLGSGHNGYVGWRAKMGAATANNAKMRFNLREKSVLAHSKSSVSPPAPLTSFSWNQPSPNLIVTSSIDTTCTVWDLPTRTALTQLIAHDREVYDVDWCPGSSDVFASVGADGSVRVFDLRSLEHSTIIYETAGPPPPTSGSRPGTGMSTSSSRNGGSTAGGNGNGGGGAGTTAAPLLRIAFNPWDANYLATFHLESDCIQILDVRAPGLPILELKGHKAAINAVAWGPPSLGGAGAGPMGSGSSLGALGGAAASPALGGSASSSGGASSISKGMICTASDDAQVLLYDLASSTLRSASAQGRRSRNSNAAAAAAANSPAPGHHHSLSHSMSSASLSSAAGAGSSATPWGAPGIPAETPFMAWDAPEMVNNVAWFRPASAPGGGSGHGHGHGHSHSRSGSMGLNSVVAEWNEYAANARGGGGNSGGGNRREDWMVAVAGKELRALRVA